MTQYSRGANFERQVKKLWEERGWFVVRSAGSKGPVDLVAIRGRYGDNSGTAAVCLIQCKISGRISPSKLIELENLATYVGASAFIATKENPIG